MTKRNFIAIFYIGALFFGSLSVSGAGIAADSTRIVADEVAAVVGNSTILLSDIESMTKMVRENRKQVGSLSERSEGEEAFEMLLIQTLLAQRAKLDSLDKDMEPIDDRVEAQVAQMVEQAGGMRALEKASGKPIYQIKADITRDIQKMQLAQTMERNIRNKVTVNYTQVYDFIKKIPQDSMELVPVQYSYSQIVKIPPQTEERRYAIRERLLEYRKRILAGEKIAVLARLYSMDGSASRGGEIGPQDIHTFLGPFQDALRSLKPGQVSEIVETEFGFHIIELISLNGDMAHFRHLLLKPEFTVDETRRMTAELDSVANQVRLGNLEFPAAALKYSNDKDTKENGGKAFNKTLYMQTGDIRSTSSKFMPDELEPFDFRILKDLKVGDVSDSYEAFDRLKGDVVYKIVRMDAILPAHTANIVDDYDILEQVALNNYQNEVLDKWVDNQIKSMFIEIMPAYRGYRFERGDWLKTNNAK